MALRAAGRFSDRIRMEPECGAGTLVTLSSDGPLRALVVLPCRTLWRVVLARSLVGRVRGGIGGMLMIYSGLDNAELRDNALQKG